MFENDYKSEQAAKLLGNDYKQLRPIDLYGRQRTNCFSFNQEGLEEAGREIVLTKLVKGAKLLSVSMTYSVADSSPDSTGTLYLVDEDGVYSSLAGASDPSLDLPNNWLNYLSPGTLNSVNKVLEKTSWLVLRCETAVEANLTATFEGTVDFIVD